MRAVRFARFGGPDMLTLEDLPDLQPGALDAVIRVEAASINPSDVKNVAGAMAQTRPPRTPGRDFAGVVISGPAEWIGAEVWGSGDGGFTRDGSHAEQMLVPVAALRRKPAGLSFDQAASVGVNYLAAWRGLVDAAALQPQERVAIIGAGGGVGSAAAQIARRLGARRIVGVDRSEPHPEAAIRRVADALVVGAPDIPAAVRAAFGGAGADVVFDCVGGVMFRPALACLAPRGRLIEISATGAREVTFDLLDFYHNESRVLGVDTLQLDVTGAAAVMEELRPGFEAGDYQAAPVTSVFPLAEVQSAYRAVAGGHAGRVVLRPQT